MKLFNIITFICSITILGIMGCDKKDINLIDANNKWIYLDSSKSTNIKIVQVFAGNTPQVPTAPNLTTGPQVFIYANGAKLNGTLGTTVKSILPFIISNFVAPLGMFA